MTISALPVRRAPFGVSTARSKCGNASPTTFRWVRSRPFPRSVHLEEGEIVIFAWIVFESREHRDRVNAEVMKDPRLAEMMKPEAMPFDGKRMFYGGFNVAVEA